VLESLKTEVATVVTSLTVTVDTVAMNHENIARLAMPASSLARTFGKQRRVITVSDSR